MMRSLWTAASGMSSQQLNVDTISNNLANVNTTAYKKERLEFKSLLYQTMQRADLDATNQTGRPVNLQVGLGVRPIATARIFETGNLEATYNQTDFAIDGPGFFMVQKSIDEVAYTKDGTFKTSPTEEGGIMLTTSEGYPILSIDEEPVIIPEDVAISQLSVNDVGELSYIDADGMQQPLDVQFAIVQFSNVQGLEATGGNLYRQTMASGGPLFEVNGETNRISNLIQGYVEMSNVQVAEEMVKLIVAQRAYELNSKAITTSDEMLQQANNLKR